MVYKIDCLLMPKKQQQTNKKKPTGLMSKNRGLVLRVATVGADESGQCVSDEVSNEAISAAIN